MKNKILLEITGRTTDHLVFNPNLEAHVHVEVNHDLERLKSVLDEKGHQLKVISSFRSFDHQLRIWEEKVNGIRPVLDSRENQLDISKLTNDELLFAILNWSMIPGFSRHHLGTDLDIIDTNAIDESCKVQLTASEFAEGGPFHKLDTTLDELVSGQNACGFYRPYLKQSMGVKPERWHISHFETSKQYLGQLTIGLFEELISSMNFSLKDEILNYLELIYKEYINPEN